MKMNRCKVEITSRVSHESSFCEVLLNYAEARPTYAGQWPIDYEDCELAPEHGFLDITLGNIWVRDILGL